MKDFLCLGDFMPGIAGFILVMMISVILGITRQNFGSRKLWSILWFVFSILFSLLLLSGIFCFHLPYSQFLLGGAFGYVWPW
ncbi:MAG: hypothetical protein AB1393_13495 [Candidatus Edwardsbacteria bacterium]